MQSKEDVLKSFYSRLAELQDGRVFVQRPKLAKRLGVELNLLVEVLDEDISEEFYEQARAMIDKADEWGEEDVND